MIWCVALLCLNQSFYNQSRLDGAYFTVWQIFTQPQLENLTMRTNRQEAAGSRCTGDSIVLWVPEHFEHIGIFNL